MIALCDQILPISDFLYDYCGLNVDDEYLIQITESSLKVLKCFRSGISNGLLHVTSSSHEYTMAFQPRTFPLACASSPSSSVLSVPQDAGWLFRTHQYSFAAACEPLENVHAADAKSLF